MSDDALARALIAALRPVGLAERVRVRLGGGLTALQLWERLPPSVAGALPGDDPVRVREGLARVQACLAELERDGRVERRRAKLTVTLNTKGPRDVLVDVYRARRGATSGG